MWIGSSSIFTSWRGFRSRGLSVDFGEEIEYWGDVVGKQLAPGELLECTLDARKAHLHPRVDSVEQAPLRVVLRDVLEQTQEVEEEAVMVSWKNSVNSRKADLQKCIQGDPTGLHQRLLTLI